MRGLVGRLTLYSVLVVLGLIVGLVLGQRQLITLTPRVTFGQALQAVVLVLIFLSAHRYFEKVHDRRRKTVDILVDMVRGALDRVDCAHGIFLDYAGKGPISNLERIRLDGALRDYSNSVKGIEDVLRQSGITKADQDLEKVKADRSEYKDLVTESPYPTEVPRDRIRAESRYYSQIRTNLVGLQLGLSSID